MRHLGVFHLIAAVESPDPDASATPATHLDGGDAAWALIVIVGFVLFAGLIIVLGRSVLEKPATDPSGNPSPRGRADMTLIRSWLAIALVGGLLIFVALSFWLDDTALRSTLVGGLVANAGAAVAFYFASKSSDQARKDILNASRPTTLVPDLIGRNLRKVQEALASTTLHLVSPPTSPPDEAQVVSQHPPANEPVAQGSAVTATFAGPVPDLTGKTASQAEALLATASLTLVKEPETPATDATITAQAPAAGADVPTDQKVHATFGP